MYTEEGRRFLKELRLKELPSKNSLEFYFKGIFDGVVKKNSDGSIKPSEETLQESDKWILDSLPTMIYWAFGPWGGTINYDFYNNYIDKLKDHNFYRLHVLSTFLKKLNEYIKKSEEKTEKFRKSVSQIQVLFRKKRDAVKI
jgi:hypothetical protein